LILELFGLSSDTVLEVTQKDHESSSSNDHGLISFDESSMFIPCTTMVLVQLTALATCSLGLQSPGGSGQGSRLDELLCSVFVVLCYWPFVEGLFRNGKFGIPLSTIFKSAALASLLCVLVKNATWFEIHLRFSSHLYQNQPIYVLFC
ncbi:hypothetical protein Ddye_016766, partial [Dipteronia dyeriana]